MESLRHIAHPQFGAVFFRRSTMQVRNEGGLWDEGEKLWPSAHRPRSMCCNRASRRGLRCRSLTSSMTRRS
nr:hypothetical protein [Sinorhizobium medicae]